LSAGNSSNNKILLVDDNADVTSVLSFGLKSAGFSVDVFNDPREALVEFRAGRYSLVIADIRMPKMSGFELVKEIGGADPLLKVILITAFDIKKDELEQVLPYIRVDAIVNKPVGLVKLNNLVSALLVPTPSPSPSPSTATTTTAAGSQQRTDR
jgi:DNA-binding response OmpR family regulator